MTEIHAAKPHLTHDHLLVLLRQMTRIRRFEAKCAELYQAEKIRGFLHLYDGEEAVAVGVQQVLGSADAIVATYREHGHALARGLPMAAVMAEMLGKVEGCSRGRGGSMHIFSAAARFYGGNAIVAGGLPLAVGLALGDHMQGRDAITACFFGDGAVAEGEFHESLNLAALWRLPVLFVCENNLYAMGTRLDRAQACTDLKTRAASYGLAASAVDGMNVVAVEAEAAKAAALIHSGQGPYFLECCTYRFRAHSMFDAQLYRDKAEVDEWQKRCPIRQLSQWMQASGLAHENDIAVLEAEVDREIEAAVALAEAGQLEPIEDLTKDVYTREGAA